MSTANCGCRVRSPSSTWGGRVSVFFDWMAEMATTEREILEGKVVPELQAIASSMGVQGYQRLRKADLIGAIIAKAQGVEFRPPASSVSGRRDPRKSASATSPKRPRRKAKPKEERKPV